MTRFYSALLLTTLVLLTHIGLPVYSHVCRGQEKTWHSVIVPVESCCTDRQKVRPCDDLPDAGSGQTLEKLPCCQDHTTVAGLDTDFTKNHTSFLVKVWPLAGLLQAVPPFIEFLQPVHSTSCFSFHPHAPPDRLWGRSLLLFKQSFRC
jgi:hypothetical protein